MSLINMLTYGLVKQIGPPYATNYPASYRAENTTRIAPRYPYDASVPTAIDRRSYWAARVVPDSANLEAPHYNISYAKQQQKKTELIISLSNLFGNTFNVSEQPSQPTPIPTQTEIPDLISESPVAASPEFTMPGGFPETAPISPTTPYQTPAGSPYQTPAGSPYQTPAGSPRTPRTPTGSPTTPYQTPAGSPKAYTPGKPKSPLVEQAEKIASETIPEIIESLPPRPVPEYRKKKKPPPIVTTETEMQKERRLVQAEIAQSLKRIAIIEKKLSKLNTKIGKMNPNNPEIKSYKEEAKDYQDTITKTEEMLKLLMKRRDELKTPPPKSSSSTPTPQQKPQRRGSFVSSRTRKAKPKRSYKESPVSSDAMDIDSPEYMDIDQEPPKKRKPRRKKQEQGPYVYRGRKK